MIRVLKTVFAPRLQKLSSQLEPDRVQQVKSWIWKAQHVEEGIDRADEVLIEAKAQASNPEVDSCPLRFLREGRNRS